MRLGYKGNDMIARVRKPDGETILHSNGHETYLPTAAEIRRQCEGIQAEWSPRERAARALGFDYDALIHNYDVDGTRYVEVQTVKSPVDSYNEVDDFIDECWDPSR